MKAAERCCVKATRRFPWLGLRFDASAREEQQAELIARLLATRRYAFLSIHPSFSVVALGRSMREPRTPPLRLFPAGSYLGLRFDPQGSVRRFGPFESKVAGRWLAPG